MWVTDILATFHVLFAIMWLGGGVMFGFLIAPRIGQTSPSTAREFFLKVGPGVLRYFQVVPGLTILFGLLLLGNIVAGDWSQLSLSTAWGFDVSFGMLFAIAAFIVGEAGAAPALHRLIGIFEKLGTPGAPGPEAIPPAVARARLTATVSLALLVVTMAFMVGAGFY